ncbi:NAD(P)H-dependent oxidoreductase [Methanosarcina sp. DH2]|jgi:multimeric flavodoxin WrbA|uniref:flavodoxin family protein n=1 Tax=Methanosarcina sp. DH2 TaxID=2605639 RepID=UPI001E4983DB|nr:NAD(P)H-dependent oxidoreductase [Methanosarcina sp. DH2]
MLADAFMKGAQEIGHTVNKIEVSKLNISGCKACETCWTNDGACVQCDDMAEIEPLLKSADVLVLVSPSILLWNFGTVRDCNRQTVCLLCGQLYKTA